MERTRFDQDRIDALVDNLGGAFTAMVRDTNDLDPTFDSDQDGDPTNDMDGDGIWDTAAIVIGLNHDLNRTEFNDFAELARTSRTSSTTVQLTSTART